eukprot:2508495-Pyramimonas_sp.AAC.1
MGAKGHQKLIVNGSQWASWVLRLQKVDILLTGVHLWNSIGYKAANRDTLWESITFERVMRTPYILGCDFNMHPPSIEGTNIALYMNGTIVVPDFPYADAVTKTIIDFLIEHKRLPTCIKDEGYLDGPRNPHCGLILDML